MRQGARGDCYPNLPKGKISGLVLLQQRPGSAKGVMFIARGDKTFVANLVVWINVFERNRRIVLGSTMMGVRGQVQREGAVIRVVVRDLPLLATEGSRQDVASIDHVGRADVVKHGMGPPPYLVE